MRVHRLLSMLLIIANKGLVTGKELAEHFEVSLRTIYRDIEKIAEAGIPIASNGGKGGGYYIMENYTLDNLFLNKSEVKALLPLMDNLKILFGKNNEFNDILSKLENVYKEHMDENKFSINLSHFSMEDELREYLYLMNKGIEESRLLEFDYINRNMDYSKRVAEPIHISFNHGQWYLTAYCRNRNDYRRFKLVRIRNLTLEGPFKKREITEAELKRIFAQGYEKKSIQVRLRFTDKIGEQLTEYFAKETIQREEDGTYLVTDVFPHEDGLIKFILGFGRECEVIEPEYLREETREYLIQMVKKYQA